MLSVPQLQRLRHLYGTVDASVPYLLFPSNTDKILRSNNMDDRGETVQPVFAQTKEYFPLLPVELNDARAIDCFLALNSLHHQYGIAHLNVLPSTILSKKTRADHHHAKSNVVLHGCHEARKIGPQDQPVHLKELARQANGVHEFFHPKMREDKAVQYVSPTFDYYSLTMSWYALHTNKAPPAKMTHDVVHVLPLGQFCKAYLMFRVGLL